MKDNSTPDVCPRHDIAAYVDGEVSAELSAELELHFAACSMCSRALREQRQFLSALSASLANDAEIELPEGFTKKIVVTAESSVTGLRGGRRELRTAAIIFAALLLFPIFVIGSEYLGDTSVGGGLGEKLTAFGSMLFRTAAHAATAAGVVVKALALSISGSSTLLLFGAGAVAVIFCSSVWAIRRRNA